MNTRSISLKIDVSLAVLFLIMLIVSALYQFSSQRAMVEEMVIDQANGLAESYFDNVNTLMLTGKMAQKEIARTKVTAREEVLGAKVLRGAEVSKLYGPAKGSSVAIDDLDRQALQGESIQTFYSDEQGRRLTIALPLIASTDFRGTNCLTCHATKAGTVLGAVRLDYSLQQLDARVSRQIWTNIGLSTLMLIIGLLVISWFLRKLVTKPLTSVISTLRNIEQSANLNHRIDINSNDEIGELATNFNSMMAKFSHIIQQVLGSTAQLTLESKQLDSVSAANMDGVRQQQLETDMVATAFTEMEQTSHEVATNVTEAAHAADETNSQAVAGQAKVNESIDSINALAADLNQTSRVVQHLEEQSEGIGKVVEVISNIASQTNLLALNAAIEAARAGEQGRGFAVVADEVRALATRTHDATSEIQVMIEELQTNARKTAAVMLTSCGRAADSVDQASATGQFLTDIITAINTVNSLNTQNAAAAEQQQAVATEINCSIVKINDIADQTADNSQRVTASTEALLELSNNLQQLVGQFNLEDLKQVR
ncbi:MAG: methyl-accepting chemotaxis protein [Motiliproteus sp.]